MHTDSTNEPTPTTAARILVCRDCSTQFTIEEREERWYLNKGLNVPRRCPPCRAARRAEREGQQY